MSVKWNVRLPDDLALAVDREVESEKATRTDVIVDALRARYAMDGQEGKKPAKAKVTAADVAARN